MGVETMIAERRANLKPASPKRDAVPRRQTDRKRRTPGACSQNCYSHDLKPSDISQAYRNNL